VRLGSSSVSRVLVVTAAQDLLLSTARPVKSCGVSPSWARRRLGDTVVVVGVDGSLGAVDIESGQVIWIIWTITGAPHEPAHGGGRDGVRDDRI
jgi:hypothetical protein